MSLSLISQIHLYMVLGYGFQCCRIRIFSIPDPNFCRPGFALKELSTVPYFNPKKWFLNSRKYDSGWIRILIFFYPSRIPDPGVKKAPYPGSGSATLMVSAYLSDNFHFTMLQTTPILKEKSVETKCGRSPCFLLSSSLNLQLASTSNFSELNGI